MSRTTPCKAVVISTSNEPGRVYRRCGCRDPDRRHLGARCPKLADEDHGTWYCAVDFPAGGKRNTVRRGGFPDEDSARAALRMMVDGNTHGFDGDPHQTVAAYLRDWLAEKELVLKPTTFVRYRDYVRNDLIPALGGIRLDELKHRHIRGFVRRQRKAGRGKVTLNRCLATLSSALTDAVKQRRLRFNPTRPTMLPRPQAPERMVWTAEETVRFLNHSHQADPFMADLCEVIIGTGMRRGEVLGLHWEDVHFDDHVLYVRHTLSAVDNSRLVLTAPKTRASKNWIAISPRVAAALR
ncbi:site-specific integrase [Yinghuangia soli]|uniref:Uncharacterized protein n=1 Tax=Yinghuangia soli TaxID=2908204 RepID=A0AA41QB18_9ACTN|nr:hypothetical protein [Yinghuangia soli]MCF2533634.1 hypothetical protein [Yinghuangia soli]